MPFQTSQMTQIDVSYKFVSMRISNNGNSPVLRSGLLNCLTAQWLRCCATNRKVAGSIPAGVSGFFIDPGVDSASKRNEYQEYFLGVKAAGA